MTEWISAKDVKQIYQALPDWVFPFEMWFNEKILLHGRFREGVDYKVENGEHFLSVECEEKLRQSEIAGVMGESAHRFEHRHDPPQQKYADDWNPITEEYEPRED